MCTWVHVCRCVHVGAGVHKWVHVCAGVGTWVQVCTWVCVCARGCRCAQVGACVCRCGHVGAGVCRCEHVGAHVCAGVSTWNAAGSRAQRGEAPSPTCWPPPAPEKQRWMPALRLPLLPCSAPTAVTHQHLGLGCGVSPDPYGHTFLASSAACCVMNKRLVTHQLEDRPCVPTASRGQGEQSAGSRAAPG